MQFKTIRNQTINLKNEGPSDDVEAECFLKEVAKHLMGEFPEVAEATFTLLAVKKVERGLSNEEIPGHLLLIQIDGLYRYVEPGFRLYHTASNEALDKANALAEGHSFGRGQRYSFLGKRSAQATYMHEQIVSELGGPLTENSRSHLRATRGI